MPTQTSRRMFLRGGLALGGAALLVPGAYAEDLMHTPRLTEGPFYPDKLPLDRDNDLILVGNSLTPATGQVTHLTGRVRTPAGSPVAGATIEIWQCDANEVYLHSRDSSGKSKQMDPHFQGFGRFETASDGGYRFRTIKPVPYPGRPAPHIHVKVKKGNRELLTTQVMVRGHDGNARDGIFREAGDFLDQELLMADFKPVPGSKAGELSAVFDIVLGLTPDESRPRKR